MVDPVLEQFRRITLVLTVTAGRSGTKLLSLLLSDALNLAAAHEPPPRINFVMRSFLDVPNAAGGWLVGEKLPAMLKSSRDGFYAETSHLFCKGLIDPLLSLGIFPKLVILTRAPREIACSLYRMDVIPGRTDSGRLVLLKPSDRGVLQLSNWKDLSDYQLCYWYVREIERRQSTYRAHYDKLGLDYICLDITDLQARAALAELGRFCGVKVSKDAYERQKRIVAKNQNSRASASGSLSERNLPEDLGAEEMDVDKALRQSAQSA